MKLPLPNVLIPILSVIVVVGTAETASARTKKHLFPLNAGLGKNPTNRDFYVRYCAN
jgi:hypothetical protein